MDASVGLDGQLSPVIEIGVQFGRATRGKRRSVWWPRSASWRPCYIEFSQAAGKRVAARQRALANHRVNQRQFAMY